MSPYLLDCQSPAEVPLVTLTEYINNNTAVFVMTESLENISNLRRILSLEGVTGTIVGTFDLAFDIGGIDPKALMPEVITTAFVEEKLRQVAKICKDAGKVAGIGGFQPKGCARWAKEGYQLFILGYVIDGNVDNLRPLIEEARALVN
jgi:2-keto-3-deoxy-L-rhamnonate aldolase RhmA